jgi:hypothetical protein
MDELNKTVLEISRMYPKGFLEWVKNKPGMDARLSRLEKAVNKAFGTDGLTTALAEWKETYSAYFNKYNEEKLNAVG